jgi:Polyketide cyclase / dehydrase and lipid transport
MTEGTMGLNRSIYIDRPPADVFRFYAVEHVRNHPRWDPNMHLELVTEGPIGVGTVIRRTHTHYSEPTEGTMEVVEFERDRALGVVIHDGSIEISGRMSIEPQGEGTWLTVGFEIVGGTAPIDPALLERTLRNIKTLIETEIPANP